MFACTGGGVNAKKYACYAEIFTKLDGWSEGWRIGCLYNTFGFYS